MGQDGGGGMVHLVPGEVRLGKGMVGAPVVPAAFVAERVDLGESRAARPRQLGILTHGAMTIKRAQCGAPWWWREHGDCAHDSNIMDDVITHTDRGSTTVRLCAADDGGANAKLKITYSAACSNMLTAI